MASRRASLGMALTFADERLKTHHTDIHSLNLGFALAELGTASWQRAAIDDIAAARASISSNRDPATAPAADVERSSPDPRHEEPARHRGAARARARRGLQESAGVA
jgi:hypothetical protein